MTDPITRALQAVDEAHAAEGATTRRRLVQAAAAGLGGLGLLGSAGASSAAAANDPTRILQVAATAEVLATIVNTIGHERFGVGSKAGVEQGKGRLDPTTSRNVAAAARQELIHYDTITGLGVSALTKRIWVPDAVFASPTALLQALEFGDQVFVNAYLIGTQAFAAAGNAVAARYAAQIMGVEAVHRALARQSLGELGNDRVFSVHEFTDIDEAVRLLAGAGFGFGTQGGRPGRFYDLDEVSRRTPNPPGITGTSL